MLTNPTALLQFFPPGVSREIVRLIGLWKAKALP
uniref:Uncharacterized protein n=1 Tax=Utricularia reniformis TaxID=192314 RepID=A0A1Y0B218_9LAMI|nr:hypothetical protein AEK19_MT1224 [Utricularia reniformis]ART31437.1 hypothetical protein AEK19_MT1224 [Utricularia reniformis]